MDDINEEVKMSGLVEIFMAFISHEYGNLSIYI